MRKYVFTDELVEEVRLAYLGNKIEVSERLDRLERKTGWPRWAFKNLAHRRGWASYRARRWTEEEILNVGDYIRIASVRSIAKKMGRSPEAVKLKAASLHLARRAKEGYTLLDLQVVFGEPFEKVRRWVDRGLLGKSHRTGRGVWLTERNVVRFIRVYPHEYDLRRVDQDWFKGMVFGELASYGASV